MYRHRLASWNLILTLLMKELVLLTCVEIVFVIVRINNRNLVISWEEGY